MSWPARRALLSSGTGLISMSLGKPSFSVHGDAGAMTVSSGCAERAASCPGQYTVNKVNVQDKCSPERATLLDSGSPMLNPERTVISLLIPQVVLKIVVPLGTQ